MASRYQKKDKKQPFRTLDSRIIPAQGSTMNLWLQLPGHIFESTCSRSPILVVNCAGQGNASSKKLYRLIFLFGDFTGRVRVECCHVSDWFIVYACLFLYMFRDGVWSVNKLSDTINVLVLGVGIAKRSLLKLDVGLRGWNCECVFLDKSPVSCAILRCPPSLWRG